MQSTHHPSCSPPTPSPLILCRTLRRPPSPHLHQDLFETSVAKMKMVFNDYQTHEQEQKSARESPTGVIDTPTPAVASEQPIVEAAAGNSSNGKRHSSPDDGANTGANAGAKRSKHN